jgi:hypothetical protein
MKNTKLFIQSTLLVVLSILAVVHHALAQEDGEKAHIAVENPADLVPIEADRIYEELKQQLVDGYAVADMKVIDGYQAWKRYNSTPYLSSTHGQRFVNNYANETASNYGQLGAGERYPVGTVLAKDSITVTTEGKVFPGALFVMEKLKRGGNPDTADWRYVMIIPDGSIFGDTLGDEPELVEYCHACHRARAKDDYVFFVPGDYRIEK